MRRCRQPTGDQPRAIRELVDGFRAGNQFETLLGVTGSGKTFTMANVIAALNKPTLIISHNKTLAGQLYGEMKEFFPENAVEYFVSYYDYYQPEAYVPQSDTYIAKDSAINDEIDKLRLHDVIARPGLMRIPRKRVVARRIDAVEVGARHTVAEIAPADRDAVRLDVHRQHGLLVEFEGDRDGRLPLRVTRVTFTP